MLILKALSLQPMHGYGIARRIEQISRGVFKVNPGSLLTALQRLDALGLARVRVAARPRTRGGPRCTASPAPATSSSRARRPTGPAGSPRSLACSRRRRESRGALAPGGAGVAGPVDRPAADRDVTDEVQHYLDQATAAHQSRGSRVPRRRARRDSKPATSPASTQEVRSYGWENAVDDFRADLRFAARRLRSEPGFTAVAAITLAVGIGATTAIVSAVNPILFQPLPYPDAGSVVAVSDVGPDGSRAALTFGTYREVEARTRSFESFACSSPGSRRCRDDRPRAARRPAHRRGILPFARCRPAHRVATSGRR